MGPQRLSQALSRHRLIALDTCVLIYVLEGDERFGPAAEAVLARVRDGRNEAVLSTVALLEVQVGPYRAEAYDCAERYYALLAHWPNLRWVPVTYAIADRAARIRAEHNVPAPDAIHLATALESRCGLFVTNDAGLPAVAGLSCLLLPPS